jgi:UDP-N-acetylmuramate dehydrogenase
MFVEKNVALREHNSFGIVAKALALVRISSVDDLLAAIVATQGTPQDFATHPPFILGGGCNIVLTGDVKPLTLKIEILGKRLVRETDKHWIVEVGAGENWHQTVTWTLQQGWPGLENLALIPGSVGASPVQNIGAYGVELQDRFDSLDAVHLHTGQAFTLTAAQCAFGYRDSVFKHSSGQRYTSEQENTSLQENTADGAQSYGMGLLNKAVITHVRFALPKQWRPELAYGDLQRKWAQYLEENGLQPKQILLKQLSNTEQLEALLQLGRSAGLTPTAQQICDWVCQVRSAKLPDPAVIGNAGSFFKNPQVTPEQCADIIARDPKVVHYPMADGSIKLAAGWLIDACGWKGKTVGNAGVYDKQALVLVNKGTGTATPATGGEVITLAKAIQTSVYERFGIMLEHEPVVV